MGTHHQSLDQCRHQNSQAGSRGAAAAVAYANVYLTIIYTSIQAFVTLVNIYLGTGNRNSRLIAWYAFKHREETEAFETRQVNPMNDQGALAELHKKVKMVEHMIDDYAHARVTKDLDSYDVDVEVDV